MLPTLRLAPVAAVLLLSATLAVSQSSFINWESPHVHPLDLTADGSLLVAVNTPDARLELFDASGAQPVALGSVPVGLDPVSVRLRTATEAWVVNHVSDTVSVVDLVGLNVVATLDTDDEPCDVVFAGNPERAFVSCSQANTLLVFDPANLDTAPTTIAIAAEEPRALAVSADGSKVLAAIFDSGNGSTILAGGGTFPGAYPPNVVNDPAGPYGGQNPPPNAGVAFDPPINGGLPTPLKVGLIVKKDDQGDWMDDNGGDWTDLVSGANAALSGRPVGWDLPDRDVAIVDVGTLGVTYATRMMNHCTALAVNPATGDVTVVGTDATNEVRFEPNLNGVFLRVEIGFASQAGATLGVFDLNPHLDYTQPTVPQATRDQSLGDPRGIVWSDDGSTGYVSGLGSNNLVVIDATGSRAGLAPTIEVGEGPTGLALDDAGGKLYVLDRFESALSVVDTTTELETARVAFHDASPAAIGVGRKHLYDTHETSGLGHTACASCHVDARMDRLAWDLGDPSGDMKPFSGNCPDNGCEDWHPMKGPMLTQTMLDIVGKEPHHWRGDRTGIEEFNPAFEGLLGDDAQLTATEMQEFEDFLATLHFPPNPFRSFDNALPDDLPLPGHYTTGRFAPAGQPLPDGDATRGLALYRPPNLLDGFACVTCHALPSGLGTDYMQQGPSLVPIPPGPDGEHHHGLVSVDESTNISIKVPQLRNLYERVGFEATQASNAAGFGFLHDGSVDSIARFVSEPLFAVTSDQDVADLVAFMLSFSGSDLPQGSTTNPLEPPGTASQDTHAAVGVQVTIQDGANVPAADAQLVSDMLGLADGGEVGLVVKGVQLGEARGYAYVGIDLFQSDRAGDTLLAGTLLAAAAPGSELTWTVVPAGTEERLGIDRDEDGFFDRDELDAGSDPADPDSVPGASGTPYCFGDGGGTPCPCGNDDAGGSGGCANSTGAGAVLSADGTPSTSSDSLQFSGANLRPNQPSLLFQGDNALNGGDGFSFGDGLRCAGSSVVRLAVLVPDGQGDVEYPGTGDPPVSVAGGVQAGDTKRYQLWYRDPAGGPCTNGFNLTNGFEVAWQ